MTIGIYVEKVSFALGGRRADADIGAVRSRPEVAETEGFEPSIELYNPITV
jgi:hypothetical protein